MSEKIIIDDDELDMLLNKSLPFEENELPSVTDELINKTIGYIRENAAESPAWDSSDNSDNTGQNAAGNNAGQNNSGNYGADNPENSEKTNLPPKKGLRRKYIYWISGAAACFVVAAGALLLSKSGLLGVKTNPSDLAMNDYNTNGTEAADGAAEDSVEYDEAFNDADYTDGAVCFDKSGQNAADNNSENCGADNDGLGYSDESPESEEFSYSEKASDTEDADTSGNNPDDGITSKNPTDTMSTAKISGADIKFPESILNCDNGSLKTAIISTPNEGNESFTEENMEDFTNYMENELSTLKENYDISQKKYYQLSKDWTKKILIEFKEPVDNTLFYSIYTYKNGFALCPLPPSELNPDSIFTIYN